MKKLRMAVRANTAWFAAKDVCDALGLGDVSVALRRLPSHGKMSTAVSDGRRLIMINTMALGLLACKPEYSEFLLSAAEQSSGLLKQPKDVFGPEDGFFTVAEYADKQGLMLVKAEASKIGKLAMQISRERGLPVHRHKHDLFGTINAYSEEAIRCAFEDTDADKA